ncbi:arylsulfotransferase family protein [Nocardioides sp. T5]|uniref:arylsulfotransferase family protein n=1 Tax=Nocardioides sp. T5 TaxID=3400182 RepID=UPI003A86710F
MDVTGAAQVWFNGVPDSDGSTTFTGLASGEEISVFVDGASGRSHYALYVLPEGFPTLAGTVTGTVAPGNVGLTLDRFDGGSSPQFEAIVDRQGVPVYTRRVTGGAVMDLKQSPKGAVTVHRRTTTQGKTGTALVELDDQFREVARHETVGRVHTDNHDGLLMDDGSVWLIGYEPNPATEKTDSVIQHVSADGEVLFDWSTAPYAAETTATNPDNPDYAHINSIDVTDNGDVIASFRHFSSVWRIATQDRPGHQEGDIVWKLGGRDSSFEFADGEDGPCAQHTATVLPNGNVLMFDNGGHSFWGARCVDQDAPWGPLVDRPTTRVAEWDLDEVAGTATVARTYGSTDRFSGFAGGAYRLDNGNVLISWTPSRLTLANEVTADDEPVWELVDTASEADRYTSYRAQLVTVPDRIDPEVSLDGPGDGVTVVQGSNVPVSFSCTDRGGSTLRACDGPEDQRLDTSTVGTHTWSVTAQDGAGRTVTTSRSYTVTAPPGATPASPAPPTTAPPTTAPQTTPAPLPASPDLAIRLPGTRWVGNGSLAPQRQAVRAQVRAGRLVRAKLRVRNDGGDTGRFVLRAPSTLARGSVEVTYVHRGRTRTGAMDARGWRTPALAPGESLRLAVRVRARGSAEPRRDTLPVTATSPAGRDRVRLVVRVRR